MKTSKKTAFQALGYGVVLAAALFVTGVRTEGGVQSSDSRERYYKKWLEEDVVYLITEEESAVFKNLQTQEEKDRFIEQFWVRRDPTPETPYNESKEEHYRRIQYANDHFGSGIQGWRTDRGRFYIKFGPPDRRETHPSGGHYQRTSWEGGGSTSTYPFERWEYRYIAGVGEDIELEFVDPTLSGEYRLSMDPDDKDALLHVSGAGLTMAEEMGMAHRVDRILKKTSPMPGHSPLLTGYGRAKDQPFEKLRTFTDLQRPPSNTFRDLFRPEVVAQVHYNQLGFEMGVDAFPADEDIYNVGVTVMIPNAELQYTRLDGPTFQSVLEVYGRITSVSGKTVTIFEEMIGHHINEAELADRRSQSAMYQKSLDLPWGRYKLDLIVRNQNSDKVGHKSQGIILSPVAADTLVVSSVVLAKRIEMQSDSGGAFGPAKVFPNLNRAFTPEQSLLVYYQLSNLTIDEATQQPNATAKIEIRDGPAILVGDEIHIRDQARNRSRLYLVHDLPLSGMVPGDYEVALLVEDRISGRRVEQSSGFRVSKEPAAP